MSSRDQILGNLRRIAAPFGEIPEVPLTQRPRISPMGETDADSLRARFIAEAQALHCSVHEVADDEAAIEEILGLIGGETEVMSWDFAHIPVRGLQEALAARSITRTRPDADHTQIGITGADAALAATGSLIMMGSPEKAPQVSLLPMVHIAVLRAERIVADLESFAAQQRVQGIDHFRQTYNVAIITGPSKTADIASELVMGVHGPGEVHVILLP